MLRKKALQENKDMYLVLLEYRATPINSNLPSPAEILFNRKIKTNIPMKESLLKQKVKHQKIYNALETNQLQQQKYYNRHARDLKKLNKGDRVVIQNDKKEWKTGTVVSVDSHRPRAYNVCFDNKDTTYNRNRKFIRKFKNTSNYVDPDVYENVFQHYKCKLDLEQRVSAPELNKPSNNDRRKSSVVCSDEPIQEEQPAEIVSTKRIRRPPERLCYH